MVSPNTLRFVVGILGNVIAFFLFLSPLPTFIKIWKKGSVEQYSAVPYLVTYLNCMLWIVYGLPMVRPHSLLLLTINAAGWFIQLTYLIIFIICSKDKSKRLRLIIIILVEMSFVAVVTSCTLTFIHSSSGKVRVIGTIGVVTATLMYASPLSVMKLVMKTKSVEFMPLGLSVASFSNALVWTVYGVLPLDPYVVGPSVMGVLFGLAQLILYAIYFKSTNQQQKEVEILGEIGVVTKTTELGRADDEVINGTDKKVQLRTQVV